MNLQDLRHSAIFDNLDVLKWMIASIIVIVTFYKWYRRTRVKLPPGPWGLPFIGYLPFFSKYPFIDLTKLTGKYGNIFSINLGGANNVVLNDFESVKEALNDPAVMDRPAHFFNFVPNGLGFAGHNGAEWVEQRRFAMKTLKDIGLGRHPWERNLETEVEDFIQLLEQQNGKPYDVNDILTASVSNNVTSIILGKPLSRGDPRRAIVDGGIEGAIASFSSSSLAALFPFLMQFLSKLGLTSKASTFKKLSGFHEFIMSEIKRRKNIPSVEWNEEIFIDGYLKEIEKTKEKGMDTWFSEINLAGSSQALIIGGSDTTRAYLGWIFLAMAHYPELQKKIQKEIDAILGKDGKLNWSQRSKLPYTYATILETHRWRTVLPLGVLHCTNQHTKIGGYDIPKGTNILTNLYALHNDPKYWKNPDRFSPKRFLDENGSVIMTRLNSFLPFGLGRRICPGEMIAMMEIFHYFTVTMQKFDILPSENSLPNINDGINGATFQPLPQKLRYILRA